MENTDHTAENNMLRTELELLIKERERLLVITGVAAGLIAEINTNDLPIRTVEAAACQYCILSSSSFSYSGELK